MKTKQIKAKTKDREASEERLLIAAEQIFAKHGFKGATTRMIAKKADINIALITRYFDGKYGLLLKVIERKAFENTKIPLPYHPQNSITEECHQYALLRFNSCIKDLDFFKIAMAQFFTDAKFLKRFQEILEDAVKFTEFEQRLITLKENKKLKDNACIETVFDTIETYVFGHIISWNIIHAHTAEESRIALKNFVQAYCLHLEV